MISIVTDDDVEAGVVGREGVVGLPALLGVESGPFRAMCQMPSTGTSIPVASFLSIAATNPTLSRIMLRYVHAYTVQLASTAQVNATYTVEQRLARWILMCRDRAEGDELHLTHEFLAMMLGVRRPGVTVATHVLEGLHLIRAQRGRITVRDGDKLREFADGCYGMAEAEYERVMSSPVDVAPTRGLRLTAPALSLVR